MRNIFLLTIILSISFSFTIDGIVFANPSGEQIIFKLYNDETSALKTNDNSLWIEKTVYGYDIKYDSYENIAGFQFNLSGLKDHNNYQFTNGQMQKNNFIFQKNKKTIIAYSFEGRVLPIGNHTLLEIRNINQKKDKLLNTNTSNSKNQIKSNIDITNVVFSDTKGNLLKVNLLCHKSECKDYQYNYNSENSNNSTGNNFSSDIVTLSLKTKDSITWEVHYNSNIEIGGYQFDIEGAEVTQAYGGDSSQNNFSISTNSKTILAFSFKGDSIPAGEGKLLEFEINPYEK